MRMYGTEVAVIREKRENREDLINETQNQPLREYGHCREVSDEISLV